MNAANDFERTLATWLERDGPDDVPGRVIEAAILEARGVRQRPRWLSLTWLASLGGAEMKLGEVIQDVPTAPITRAPPRMRWVVVVLAALVALVGGLLAAGALRSQLVVSLAGCPPGTTPDVAGPSDQERPPSDVLGLPAVWDGDRGLIRTGEAVTWRFDVCENRWHKSATLGAHPGNVLVYDVDSDVIVGFGYGRVYRYDPDEARWTWLSTAPTQHALAAYDAVSGLILVTNLGPNPRAGVPHDLPRMWTYDVDRDTWTVVDQGRHLPPYEPAGALFEYDVAADRFVLLRNNQDHASLRTWEFDLRAHRWEPASTETPDLWLGWFAEGGMGYDVANERMLVFGSHGLLAAYDATADEWEVVYQAPEYEPLDRQPYASAYDPVNHRLVLFGGERRTADPISGEFANWVATDDVVAFDLATRNWTELLAASR